MSDGIDESRRGSPARIALARLLRFSRRMMAAARRDAWEEVAALEPDRRRALEKFFAEGMSHQLPVEVVRQALEQMKAMEARMVQRAMAARQAVMGELDGLDASRRAVNAYTDHQPR